MIIGIGSDIVNINRIDKTINRFGERFKNRVFTDIEIFKSENRMHKAASYAKRFAAKEAFSKALGTGFSKGVFMKDLGVVNLKSGKPTMEISGKALIKLNEIIPSGFFPNIELSLSDEFPLAYAIVIISAQRRVDESVGKVLKV
tara:strand:- start:92 stop:523 length:432 start_codon:yes stop_codon:yes gene_type:complete